MSLRKHQPQHRSPLKARGLSLIELLVSVTIGLIVSLAITTVLINSNASQRTSTSVNDAVQTGAFTSMSIDRLVRSAGSGFIQFRQGLGCLINASIKQPGPVQILPRTTALPAPFQDIGMSIPVQLAPVVIVDGGVASGAELSDMLIVMSGSHGFSETALTMRPNTATATTASVGSTLGLSPNDLVLVADKTPGGGCMVQQVASIADPVITFGNKYSASVGATTNLPAFAPLPTATILPIGNVGVSVTDPDPNPPSFYVYGVTGNELVRSNLLAPSATPAEVLAEGVVSIQAIYGTGAATAPLNDATPVIPAPLIWQAPTVNYAASSSGLLSGSVASKALFPEIKAVRIAMVLRSAVEEKIVVAPATLQMFSDSGIPVTYTVPTADLHFRHRVVETLIPLRNL